MKEKLITNGLFLKIPRIVSVGHATSGTLSLLSTLHWLENTFHE